MPAPTKLLAAAAISATLALAPAQAASAAPTAGSSGSSNVGSATADTPGSAILTILNTILCAAVTASGSCSGHDIAPVN
ncbi:hypothetical protein VMT65_00985 [Nocardia sp. CDC153]|uniref:hypothetical protein n=1 Tax=Nocardia sp. CDC153 TaxID=3112167 RepID=UPI002DB9863A|nr:hypothetical protein [Nocardia sp. CDC153]MEC3951594.1 hypothetical protein [Nocardia sp. CDC153]